MGTSFVLILVWVPRVARAVGDTIGQDKPGMEPGTRPAVATFASIGRFSYGSPEVRSESDVHSAKPSARNLCQVE